MALAYLLDPCEQYQDRSGVNNVNGYFEVFISDTDDHATVYTDFNGTLAPERIGIDLNGRAVMIVDSALTYRVEMYEPNGHMVFSQYPVWTQKSGGGVSGTNVISTDGSIQVDKYSVGSMTTYDIGMAPADSDEFLEWIKCSEEDCGATWKPVWQSGTMETEAQGIKVHGGHLYHFTTTFYVDPDGTGANYDTFAVNMYCGAVVVDSRQFDIDSSTNDSVMCEFSSDIIPEEDGCIYFALTIPSTCEVTGEVQVHRIYSGVNAVPDTCATKQWVEEYYDEISRNTQSDWTENDSTKPSYIKHRPDLSLYVTDTELETILAGYVTTTAMETALEAKQDVLSAGSGISISGSTVTNTAPNVQSDWTAASGSAAEILHKPTEKNVVAGAGIDIAETSNNVTISSTITETVIGTVTV